MAHFMTSQFAEATEKTFRDGMRHLASGVCVVTLGGGEWRTGITATSVVSLSVEPPTLLVCINRGSSSYASVQSLGAFAVNVLASDQRQIAERFAGAFGLKGADRFRDGRWFVLPSGAPCLAASAAVFDCEVEEQLERHTHAIVIGRVRRVLLGDGRGALLYWRGAYDQLDCSQDELARTKSSLREPVIAQLSVNSPDPKIDRSHCTV